MTRNIFSTIVWCNICISNVHRFYSLTYMDKEFGSCNQGNMSNRTRTSHLPPYCFSSAAILFLNYRHIVLICRHIVSHLPPHCFSTAAILFLICRHIVSQLPPYCFSTAAILFLGRFCNFLSCSGPNDSNELCILSHMGVTATAEASVVRFIGFRPTKTHLEGRNYSAEFFLFSNGLPIAVIVTLNAPTDNEMGQLCLVSLSIAQNKPETRITCVTYLTKYRSNVGWVALAYMSSAMFKRIFQ